MMVMSPSPMNAPSIVSPSSMVRQITSATGQEEQVDFMVSLGCENGGLEHLHFPPKAHLHSGLTTPRKHPSTHSENGRATYEDIPIIWEKRTRSWSNYPRARTQASPTSADGRLRRPHRGGSDHPQGGGPHRYPALECDEEDGPDPVRGPAGEAGDREQTLPA